MGCECGGHLFGSQPCHISKLVKSGLSGVFIGYGPSPAIRIVNVAVISLGPSPVIWIIRVVVISLGPSPALWVMSVVVISLSPSSVN